MPVRPTAIAKILQPNDVGETGAHQVGMHVVKNPAVLSFFPELAAGLENPNVDPFLVVDHRGCEWGFRWIYYNNKLWKEHGTRDEYRVTRMTSFCREYEVKSGDLLAFYRDGDQYACEHFLATDPIRWPYGSPIAQQWLVLQQGSVGVKNRIRHASVHQPAEIYSTGLPEGAKTSVSVNRYERSRQNRAACIAYHGLMCKVCEMSFSERYGEVGDGYTHVHHVTPVSELEPGYSIDPRHDLVPVCPNCHAMLHRKNPPYSVSELRRNLK